MRAHYLLMLALLAAPSFAAFSLQSFSCNSQSGTVTVESGVSFNCEAVLKNDGSTAANVTSVSISASSPLWTESATYSGTGYSSTVQGGATTTATFTGIKSVLSGPHNFDTVSATPSGALDADVTSTSINVVSIKAVTLASPSSAAPDEQFSVGATVTIGGSLPVAAAISITGGTCSLVSGEAASKSLGTMSNEVPSATSWALSQGSSGNCSFMVTASSSAYSPKSASGTVPLGPDITAPYINGLSASAVTTSSATISWTTNEFSTTRLEYGPTAAYGTSTALDPALVKSHSVSLSGLSAGTTYYYRAMSKDAANNTATSGSYSFTTASVSSGSPGGSSSSGGSVAVSSAVKETRTIASLEPGVPAALNFSKAELSVSEIRLESLSRLSNVSVSVEKLDSRPASLAIPEGKVYKYLNVSSSVPGASLKRVAFKFRVERSWISNNSFSTSTVYLNRYSAGWSRLPTVFLSSDSKYSYFESESPGLSMFAVTGEKPAVPAPAAPAPEEPAPVSPTPSGLAPIVSLVTQADIDNAIGFLNSVSPKTADAGRLLEQARLRIAEAQAAFDNGEQALAKQRLDDAIALVNEAAGLKSAAVSTGKKSIFTMLLMLVVLVVGVYAYYTRPPARESVSSLAELRKERDTIVKMKKAAEREYLNRKVDQATYKKMLSDYESKLVEVNTRIGEISKKDN